MKVEKRHVVERGGVALVQAVTVTNLKWLFREQSVSDFGIDAHVEVVANGRATGRLLALQIRSGESYFRGATPQGFVFRDSTAHLEYWLNHSLPVLIVICRATSQEAYWQVISHHTVERTEGGWKTLVPHTQPYGVAAAESLARLAAARTTPGALAHYGVSTEDVGETSPEGMLGALLTTSTVLTGGVAVIPTETREYHASRVAAADALVAVLVTTSSAYGTVFVLQQGSTGWSVRTQLPVSTKYADSIEGCLIPGSPAPVLVVRHPTSWGTGTLLVQERWFLLLDEPKLILEFPVTGYVVGWGLLFDRHIDGYASLVPSEIAGGARVEIAFHVRYTPPLTDDGDETGPEIQITKNVHLEWRVSGLAFADLPTSELLLEDTLEFYADDDARFITRNIDALVRLGAAGGERERGWLGALAQKSAPAERARLQGVLTD